MARIIKPPTAVNRENFNHQRVSIALFGSIEQGKAIDWQSGCIEMLKEYDIDIYSPRRDHWDYSWVQAKDNPQFKDQVEWELTVLECADVRLFYFDPSTMSPITLMELGLASAWGSISETVVCCPDGFWRKGNVDVVCERYGIHTEPSLNDTIYDAILRLEHGFKVARPLVEIPIIQPIEEIPVIIDIIDE